MIKNLYSLAFGFIVIALFLVIVSAGESEGEIIVPDDYPTINKAIEKASPGETITVLDGLYYQGVVVNKTVNLQGNGSGTVISGYIVEDEVINETFEIWPPITPEWYDSPSNVWQQSSHAYEGDYSALLEGPVDGASGAFIHLDLSNYIAVHISFWYYTTELEATDVEVIIDDYNYEANITYLDVSIQDTWRYWEATYIPSFDIIAGDFGFGLISDLGSVAELLYLDQINITGILNGNCVDIQASGVTFQNFNITTAEQNGIKINNTNNVYISNCIINTNSMAGIVIDGGAHNIIRYCNVSSNQESGIMLTHSFNNNISNNLIHINEDYGIYALYSNFTEIYDNEIVSNYHVGIGDMFGNNLTISYNNISSNEGYGIWLNVHNNNSLIYKNNISSNLGDGIFIRSNNNSNIIDNEIYSNNRYGILTIAPENLNISYNNISSNHNTGIHLSGGGGIKMYSNVITNNFYGIGSIFFGDYCEIVGNTFYNNNNSIYIGVFGDYIHISHNIIYDDNQADGTEIYLGPGVKYGIIEYNEIHSNRSKGIVLSSASNNVIRNNTIYGNTNYSVSLSNSHNNLIEDNTIYNSSVAGIYLFNSNWNTINNITFIDNDVGAYMLSSSNNTITNCTFEDNAMGLYITSNSYNNTIHSNRFVNNTVHAEDGINTVWYNPVTLRGNYWDTYTGYDLDGDGIGDTDLPYGYDPYPITTNVPPPTIADIFQFELFISLMLFLAMLVIVVRIKKKMIK